MGLFSKVISERAGMLDTWAREVILLFERYSRCRPVSCLISFTSEMKFFRKLSSCRFLSESATSSTVIKLLLRFRMRSLSSPCRFSIFRILLSFRSRTSRFGRQSKFSIVSIKFLLKMRTRRCWKAGNLDISASLLDERSKKVRLGRLTMFSILTISF